MTGHDHRAPESERGFPRVPPGLAGIVSFVAPGLGHLLLRLWSRAAIWLVGWLVVGAASQASHSAPMLALMLIAGLDAYFCGRAAEHEQEHETPGAHPA